MQKSNPKKKRRRGKQEKGKQRHRTRTDNERGKLKPKNEAAQGAIVQATLGKNKDSNWEMTCCKGAPKVVGKVRTHGQDKWANP